MSPFAWAWLRKLTEKQRQPKPADPYVLALIRASAQRRRLH